MQPHLPIIVYTMKSIANLFAARPLRGGEHHRATAHNPGETALNKATETKENQTTDAPRTNVATATAPLTAERQRDILLGSVKAYLLRHARNELIATDVAFNDMANAVRLIENAAKS